MEIMVIHLIPYTGVLLELPAKFRAISSDIIQKTAPPIVLAISNLRSMVILIVG
jgi:hypothetical protein